MAKALFVLPAVIAYVSVCEVSASLAATVSTDVPLAEFSATLKVWSLTTGSNSLTSLTVTVIVAVSFLVGARLSVTWTVRL